MTARSATPPTATDTAQIREPSASGSGTAAGEVDRASRSVVRRRRRSLRLRLTALYTLLFLVGGTILLAATYLLVDHATGRSITYTSPDGSYTVTLSGKDQNGSGAAPSDARSASGATGHDTEPKAPPTADEKTLRALALQQHAESMHQLLLQGAIALALATLASAGLGWWIAGRTLRPLRTIIATVRDISATSLHRRVALHGPPDELTELGDTFDDLLDRLEASFEAQRQFVANASHELRTPLARQRAIGQVALDDPDADQDTLREAHERILRAGREQEQLIDALLALARGQTGPQRRTGIDLADLVRRAVEAHHVSDPEIITTLDPAATAGDPRLLQRLIVNLVDNAIHHNIPDGRVQITTRRGHDGAVLIVDNTGPEISPEDIEAFVKPFLRGTTERTARSHGLGLGLPIVQAIANAHQASLRIQPRPGGGLHVQIRFPPPGGPSNG